MIKLLLIIIWSGLFMLSCSEKERQKPDNVPEQAQWVGGIDGGVWILIDVKVSELEYNMSVWFESGKEWESGIYILMCECREIDYSIENIYEMARSYTANMLRLKKSCDDGTRCYLKLLKQE